MKRFIWRTVRARAIHSLVTGIVCAWETLVLPAHLPGEWDDDSVWLHSLLLSIRTSVAFSSLLSVLCSVNLTLPLGTWPVADYNITCNLGATPSRKFLSSSLFERQTVLKNVVESSLIYASPDASKSHGCWVRWKPRAGPPPGSPTWLAGTQGVEHHCCLPESALAGRWTGRARARNGTRHSLGMWASQQEAQALHQYPIPKLP